MVPEHWSQRLALPVIAAPMTGVSGPELVGAACAAGIIGAFPTHNAPSTAALEDWLDQIRQTLESSGAAGPHAPVAANLVVHRSNTRRDDDLDALLRAGVELVITSVGSPKDVIPRLHDAGVRVYADVATLRHAELAAAAGVDGLVLLAAGAGGQTGWSNPFAFVRAVRPVFDGTLVLAGGVSDGAGVVAAQALGADLVYLGTRFIATTESRAAHAYKAAVVASTLDDVTTSTQVSGLAANILTSWLREHPDAPSATTGGGFSHQRLLTGDQVWAAGHSASGTNDILPVRDLVERLVDEHRAALDVLPIPTTWR